MHENHSQEISSFKTKMDSSESDKTVYITVIGDSHCGKTSLIAAAATETFPDNPPPVLPPAKLPADTTPEGVPVVITDTSSRSEDKEALETACRQASVIVLCFRMETHRMDSLRRISSYWMPELKKLNVRVPILLVGCKSDVRPADQSLHKAVLPIVKAYPQIETCMECSAKKLQYVGEVFYYALKAVLYPMAPLYDPESQTLQPLCVRALKRIFSLCDKDRDGVLNDSELNEFQVKCFNAPLQPEELSGVKEVVKSRLDNGLSEDGFLTFSGFVFLHALFIERGRLETTWAVLSKFGYGKDLKLHINFKNNKTRYELSDMGEKYFSNLFDTFDVDNDGALSTKEQEQLFSSFPENPIVKLGPGILFERTKKGLLTLNGFICFWNYVAVTSPANVIAGAMYSGISTEEEALSLMDSKSTASLITCNVFGSEKAQCLQISAGLVKNGSNMSDGDVVNGSVGIVMMEDGKERNRHYLALLLQSRNDLKVADINVSAFIVDWSRPEEFTSTIEEMVSIASSSGDTMPCILLGVNKQKACDSFVAEVQMICGNLGIPEPIEYDPTDSNAAYVAIVKACLFPEEYIPETPSLLATKRQRRFVARATMYASVATLVGLSGYLTYRVYRTRCAQAKRLDV